MGNRTSQSSSYPDQSRRGSFETTHWSVVLSAGGNFLPEAQEALEKLCRSYWYPLYIHVRRLGWTEEDAKDLTQQFFARLLERKYLERADPGRGRFRSFLLTSLKNFLTHEWEKTRAQKRGGGMRPLCWDAFDPEERYRYEPVDKLTPERIYEKRWATTLLEDVLARLRAEYQTAERGAEFEELKTFVWSDADGGSYAEVCARLRIEENAVKVAVHRLRKRFREQLRLQVSRTVSSPAEVDDELRYLLSVMSE